MKKSLLLFALAFVWATRALAADAAPDPAYERMVDGRIAVNYYNRYLQDIVVNARLYLADYMTDSMKNADRFIAEGNYDRGAPGFRGGDNSWQHEKDILTLPTRVPASFSDADQKLFKTGIDQIRADTGEIMKIANELHDYLGSSGGWKDDKCQKYIAVKPRLEALVADLRKNIDTVGTRALEMARAGQKLYWEQDKEFGYFIRTMQADVDTAQAIVDLVKNPELLKPGNTAAAGTLPKVEALVDTLKQSAATNATLTTPILDARGGGDMKRYKENFYTRDIESFIEKIERDIIPGLKKGILKPGDVDDRFSAGSMKGTFRRFLESYPGVTIKYRSDLPSSYLNDMPPA